MHVCNSYITDHLWLSTEQWWTPAHGCGKLVHHVAPSATQPDIQQKHQFNGIIFFQGNRVSWYQKGRIILKFSKARNYEALGWQWHWLDHMQTIYTQIAMTTPDQQI